MFRLIRRCFQMNAAASMPQDGIIRNAPLMGHQYDTEQGLILETDVAWGIMCSQALHNHVNPTCDATPRGDWYDTAYEDPESIDLDNGGMPLNHNYYTSMYTEGIKFIWHGKL